MQKDVDEVKKARDEMKKIREKKESTSRSDEKKKVFSLRRSSD